MRKDHDIYWKSKREEKYLIRTIPCVGQSLRDESFRKPLTSRDEDNLAARDTIE